MKNYKNFLSILLLIILTSSTIVGQVEFTLKNGQDVISGNDTYFETDIMVSVPVAADSFVLGAGQLYFNYNTAAFGENVITANSVEIIRDGYLLGQKDGALDVINVYSMPVVNDNTRSRFSVAWIQDRGAGCISTTIKDTPETLFKIRIKYETPGEAADICFETDDLFTAQTFTACGPFDCNSLPAADCTGEPGRQIGDDNFMCETLLPLCTVMDIPMSDAVNNGACVTALADWQHAVNDIGEVLLSLNPMGNDVGAVTSNLYVDDAPIVYGGNTFLLQRHYKVVTENTPQSNVMLRLYFTEEEFTNLMGVGTVDSINELMVIKYSGIGEDDVYNPDEGGTLDILTPVSTGTDFNASYVEIMANSFSEFWVGIMLLPVELTDFYAVNRPQEVELKWHTATELNSDYFEVQRSSNGINFSPIAKVQAAGTTNVPQDYIHIDEQPLSGNSYYRLEQFDIDKSSTYSDVISVYREPSAISFGLYPNPADDRLFINYEDGILGDVHCKIYNVFGQEVCDMSYVIPISERIEILISQLSKGVYFIQLVNGQHSGTMEFLKY